MASLYKRKNKNSTNVWRAIVRIEGYPSVCSHFERKQEAEDWAQHGDLISPILIAFSRFS